MRRFLYMLLLCALPLVLTIATTTGYFWFAVQPRLSGDLGILGGIPFGTAYLDSLCRPRLAGNKVVEYVPGMESEAPVVTIGDSFSQQGVVGYQNFMAHAMGYPVLNVRPMGSPLQAAAALLNNGFFDTHHPHTVVIEIVERNLPVMYNVDFADKSSVKDILVPAPAPATQPALQPGPASVLKQTRNWVMLKLKLKDSPVRTARLDRPMFTLRPGMLYFYADDTNMPAFSEDVLSHLRHTLEELHARFGKRGIRLVVLVASDKYDIYQKYIVENPYPDKTLFEQMQAACDTTLYVDTKQLFMPLLESGVPDLYMANDTHWSQTGAQAVGEHLARICGKSEDEK